MQIKNLDVNIWGLEIEMLPVLKFAEDIWKEKGQELVITCARDGLHSAGSLHYYGYAVDLRTNYFSAETVSTVKAALQAKLGTDYEIVIHPTHIHVEYEKAKGKINVKLS